MSSKHQCDETCRCPLHGTQLIYAPLSNNHACQDVDCEYGHGGAPSGGAQGMNSMSEQPSLTDQIRKLTPQLKGIAALQSELADATRGMHSLAVFTTQPELTELDNELDNLYPEAPGDC